MFPIKSYDTEFHALLDALDALAAETDNEALEELNAEFEDALFLLSQIDFRGDDWREELPDALEELDALRADYARISEAEEISRQLGDLIRKAEAEADRQEGTV